MIDNPIGYMQRCIGLAESGSGSVAPNPMVGALVVFENQIIGEGFHRLYGEPHAEVNAINDAIDRGFEDMLSKATLYVNLEPCTHHGKTPPCTELIIRHRIPEVVIGCADPFPEVNGKGIRTLTAAGINVTMGILEKECEQLNKRFITRHTKKRPYIILKFAKTFDGYLAPLTGDKKISNPYSDFLVHKWRSEEQAILVGKNTALMDNPQLTVRKWNGNNPLRVVIDKYLDLPADLNVFNPDAQTLIVNAGRNDYDSNIEYATVPFDDLTTELCEMLYERNILSVMVEGGANLLSQFIEKDLWDEARIITSAKMFGAGLKAPGVSGIISGRIQIENDEIIFLKRS